MSNDEQLAADLRSECDKVGVPYDATGLVRHHRGGAQLAAELTREALMLTRRSRDAHAAVLDEVRRALHDYDVSQDGRGAMEAIRGALANDPGSRIVLDPPTDALDELAAEREEKAILRARLDAVLEACDTSLHPDPRHAVGWETLRERVRKAASPPKAV